MAAGEQEIMKGDWSAHMVHQAGEFVQPYAHRRVNKVIGWKIKSAKFQHSGKIGIPSTQWKNQENHQENRFDCCNLHAILLRRRGI